MFIISHRQTSETHSFTRRELVLTNTTTSEERVIQQYHFDTWPEQGLPATSAILGLVFQVQNNQRVQEHAPVVVHCRFVCLSVCLSGGVFVWWFICLSVCFSDGLSVCRCVFLVVCLFYYHQMWLLTLILGHKVMIHLCIGYSVQFFNFLLYDSKWYQITIKFLMSSMCWCIYNCDVTKCSRFSAGGGRTGVFIAISTAIERYQQEKLIDIFDLVKNLRNQRPAMVCSSYLPGSWNEYFLLSENRCDISSGVILEFYTVLQKRDELLKNFLSST